MYCLIFANKDGRKPGSFNKVKSTAAATLYKRGILFLK
jgi:hypothetical protein